MQANLASITSEKNSLSDDRYIILADHKDAVKGALAEGALNFWVENRITITVHNPDVMII